MTDYKIKKAKALLETLCKGKELNFERFLRNIRQREDEMQMALKINQYLTRHTSFNSGERLHFREKFLKHYHPIFEKEILEKHKAEKVETMGLEFVDHGSDQKGMTMTHNRKKEFCGIIMGLFLADILTGVSKLFVCKMLGRIMAPHISRSSLEKYLFQTTKEMILDAYRAVYQRILIKSNKPN